MSRYLKYVPIMASLVVVAIVGMWVTRSFRGTPLPTGGPTATTTPTGTTTLPVSTSTPTQKPPQATFVLPEGAVSIDEFAFIKGGELFFRPVTSLVPLPGGPVNTAAFGRLGQVMTYPGTSIVNDCGSPARYAYYGDGNRLFFYQVWRTPTFRTSGVDGLIGIKTRDFTITDALEATDTKNLFEVSYKKATSSCKLLLTRTPL